MAFVLETRKMDGPCLTVGDDMEMPGWVFAGARYISDWIDYQLRASQQPGCAIAIQYQGATVLNRVLGLADMARAVPLSPGHRYRMASHSKAFTAAGILLLCERGMLSLDDQVGRHVQGLHAQLAGATVRQVLANHAGIQRDGAAYPSLRQPFPDEAGLRSLLGERPIDVPGVRGKYSNLGFGLAGLVIEAVTGEPYGSWLGREVIEPVGLLHTFANAGGLCRDALAHGHSEPVLLGHRQTWPGDQSIDALDAAFGLVSTPADLCRFFAQLDPNAPVSLLSRASRLEMLHDQWEETMGPEPRSYALGLTKGGSGDWRWFGHIGGFTGMMSRTMTVPRCGLTVSVVVNAQDGRAVAWADGALKIMKWFKAEYVASLHEPGWQGRWWNAWGVLDLVATGEQVILANPAQLDPFALAPLVNVETGDQGRIHGCSAFQQAGEAVSLVRDPGGTVCGVNVAGDLWLREHVYAAELSERAIHWAAAT